ncbi:MAG: hypothetical protein ABI723_12885 [Bacteroidia bacterium]
MVVIHKAVVTPIKKQNNDEYCFSVKSIGQALTDYSTIFTKLVPPIADGVKLFGDLDEANTKADKGSQADKAFRNKLRFDGDQVLNSWAAGVSLIAQGDLDIIAKSKFPVGKNRTRYTDVAVPASPKVVDGNRPGMIKVKTPKGKGVNSIQFRLTRKDPATAVDADYTFMEPCGSSLTINGLSAGTIYFFSARAIGSVSFSGWSEPTMFMPSVI